MTNLNFQSYALAIFALANDKKQQELFFDQIKQIDQIIKDNPDFNKLISSRSLSKRQRRDIVAESLNELGFEPTIVHWIWAIIDDNNFHNFHYIFKEVDKRHQQIFNITKVIVSSPTELTEAQKTKIKQSLDATLKTDVQLEIHIKPELIGGLKIQINNQTHNNTFIRKLNDLKRQLLSREGF